MNLDELPGVHFAESGGTHVAYQLFGGGDRNFVVVPGFVTHLEQMWDVPMVARIYERLAAMGRVVAFDKRGTGLSDRSVGVPALGERIEDITAVMDAAAMEEATLFSMSEGGPMAMLFAATYPERVNSLGVYGGFVTGFHHPDVPGSEKVQFFHDFIAADLDAYYDGAGTELWVGGEAQDLDHETVRAYRRRRLNGASPDAVRSLVAMNRQIDIRSVLPTVSVPTLLLGLSEDRIGPPEGMRWMAAQMPDATYLEFEGPHMPELAVVDAMLDAFESFVTGKEATVRAVPERALATVLFTDIVSSTRTASEFGDRRWRELLDRHDELSGEIVRQHGGVVVKSTGDGLLATFSTPGRAVAAAQRLTTVLPERLAVQIRAGLHCGEIERRGDDVSGIAVHIASRVSDIASAGQVIVSRTVTDLVIGSELRFDSIGEYELKGVQHRWELFALSPVAGLG